MDESIVKVFEEQKVGTLKLSDAIRIGAKLRPQCDGQMFEQGKSCALGAAYEACFGAPPEGVWDCGFYAAAPFLQMCALRLQAQYPKALLDRVWPMNDAGNSREYIADWLAAQGL